MVPDGRNSTLEERRERKRLQNRLSQRMRRQRIKDHRDSNPETQKRAFRIQRWRLDDGLGFLLQNSRPAVLTSETDANDRQVIDHGTTEVVQPQVAKVHITPSRTLLSSEPEVIDEVGFSLPADHMLIRLITQNACRGLMQNTGVLRIGARYITTVDNSPLLPEFTIGCKTVVIRSTHRAMPIDLSPTQLQMNIPHPTWMDAIPFPKVRDNLIKRQHLFNHRQFLEDIVGDMLYLHPLPAPSQKGLVPRPSSHLERRQDDSHGASDGKGLILWGEPYVKESWEATACFLKKWAWAVEGCHELIDISNKWRTTRGGYSLRISSDSE
ncbi:hypothetical protein DER45DRAFT_576064 [Fusarium avenaceum]|nr:hypothetical protein DER45DRAFT_576064 [Fusarium avenaceum]